MPVYSFFIIDGTHIHTYDGGREGGLGCSWVRGEGGGGGEVVAEAAVLYKED